METGLKNKTVLITAASLGIGKAIAEAFASEGCNVAISSRSKDNLLSTAKEIKLKYDFEPFWSVCDLNKNKDIENTYTAVTEQFSSVDILVNNCGGPVTGMFQELDEKDWDNAYDQVLKSAVRLSKLVLPDMMRNHWGRILNITSISVKQPVDNLVLSNSLRAGLTGMAKSLSNEVAKYNITVNNVAPGMTLTRRLYELAVVEAKQKKKSHEEILVEMAKKVPMNRLGRPEEIASVVLFLASSQSSYVTGNTIQVDGGYIRSLY
ncbi:MAG: SDR family oxidoreductase [Ignavibacteria bacterium]|nr:SDR family oxidoreductase [Ignavibacteria bacterium]MBT8383189.1 SDR family oxidoreductase [Ignavibacteria bacterium]MBT8392530.1 SDR family oxidoreductase [Ignavibacteria bacterium]NNJ52471.1 SDR family oxidoreductase [Ignavibacteriaceae bacterium]NNL21736.1 SDR family oxidoreductase [Ignavibacteriaceae bacterium]